MLLACVAVSLGKDPPARYHFWLCASSSSNYLHTCSHISSHLISNSKDLVDQVTSLRTI